MANKTVYPYGTEGSLPSSIGLVNDLTTGGVDKALTAEQGKVIGDYLFGGYEEIDISGITIRDCSLGANKVWIHTNGSKHMVIPVVAGESLKVNVVNSSGDGGWYGFLTSSYVVPTENSNTPYATGCDRVWHGVYEDELTVPNGAAYLCICPVDGNGRTSTWKISRLVEAEIKDDFLTEDSPILNVNIYNDIDVESITESEWSLGGSNAWIPGTGNVARHKVIPITAGTKVLVKATNSTSTGNFRAWLTSSYVPPTSGTTIPYVSGTSRSWQSDTAGWVELVAPNTTAYLCLVTSNGDGDTTKWLVKKYNTIPINEAVEDYSLKKTDIVDNLYDGGHDAPLSAEQGKILRGLVSDGMPSGLTKHEYNGSLVVVNNKHYVATSKVATITSIACQGGACYGDYLFMFNENNTTCWIYNLASNTLLQTYTIPSDQRGFVSSCHNNTVNFGTEKYDSGDPFPLIYLSTGYASDGHTGALVYRIVATTSNSVTTYSLTLVQTLKLPGTGWTEFVVGEDGFCYLCYTSERKIYKMKMPSLSDGDMIFDLEQALSVYQFTLQPSWYNGSRNQGRIYHNGKIYFVSGVPASGEASLFVALDLATERREVEIDLYNTLGLTSEPEALFIWNGHFCIAFRANTKVYALYFE